MEILLKRMPALIGASRRIEENWGQTGLRERALEGWTDVEITQKLPLTNEPEERGKIMLAIVSKLFQA